MSSQNTTPTAKRRRVETANATLRKPFRSPLLGRPRTDSGGVGNDVSGTRLSDETVSRKTTTPSTTRIGNPHPRRSSGSALTHKAVRGSLLSAAVPPAVTGGNAEGTGEARNPLVTELWGDHGDHGDHEEDETIGKLLAKVCAHRQEFRREFGLDAGDAGPSQPPPQQRKQEADDEGPAGAANENLRLLVAKWKVATRIAAQELFELIRDRVDGMGGAKAWRQMQAGRGRGFQDEDEQRLRAQRHDEDGDRRDYDEEDGGVDYGDDRESVTATTVAGGSQDEDQDFTMHMMLKSLNIAPAEVGYDPSEDRWLE